MDGREQPCPLQVAGSPYPARRHVRQQNWMKSFRSQSRLDFTISQNVSSAGHQRGRERGRASDLGACLIVPAIPLCWP